MAVSNQDQLSVASSEYIGASAALNTYYTIFHAAHISGIRKAYLTTDGLAGSGLTGTVTLKLVAVDQAGNETDINAALNASTGGAVPNTYAVSSTTCPKNGAVLDANLQPTASPVPYSGGGVIFSLDRTTDYLVPKGSTVCAKVTTAASSLTANSLIVNVAYYEL